MDFKRILELLGLVAQHAPAVQDRLDAGDHLEKAVETAAPDLNSALKDVAAQMPVAPKNPNDKSAPTTTPLLTVLKSVFTPTDLAEHEQDQIDRASNPSGGGAG